MRGSLSQQDKGLTSHKLSHQSPLKAAGQVCEWQPWAAQTPDCQTLRIDEVKASKETEQVQ